jgi:vacuolar-type H+-ATPase subunit H
MKSQDAASDQQKYYDPAEVEAYVTDVTNTIKTLHARLLDATRRAELAEQTFGDQHADTASLGRALVLAGEVADKTIADADARAAEIIRSAEAGASGITQSAHDEANRLVDSARSAAADLFRSGETRLLEVVAAFVEGTNVLRADLEKITSHATSWRGTIPSAGPQPSRLSEGEDFIPAPPATSTTPTSSGNGRHDSPTDQDRLPPPVWQGTQVNHLATNPAEQSVVGDGTPGAGWQPPDQPGEIHNRASRNSLGDEPFDRTDIAPVLPPLLRPGDHHSNNHD